MIPLNQIIFRKSLVLFGILLIVSIVCQQEIGISEAFVLATPTTASGTAATTKRLLLFRRPTTSDISSTIQIRASKTIAATMVNLIHLRGGSEQHQQIEAARIEEVDVDGDNDLSSPILQQPQQHRLSHHHHPKYTALSMVPILFINNLVRTFSTKYTMYLDRYPIYTKSVTAGIIFAMSDLLAQLLSKKNDDTTTTGNTSSIDWTRTISSTAVGLFYFGPAAHYWYNWIFRILPTTSLVSTLQKAALGQLLFGPSFTCIFFATSLIQSGTFTIKNWVLKIRTDFLSAWIAGVGFWPIVDLISYSYIPQQYIPLFINICSFFWTTYLVLKSYK